MFGLTNLFSAIRRLVASLTRTADLVDAANEQLETRLSIDPGIDADFEQPALETTATRQDRAVKPAGNGRQRVRA